MFTLLMGHAFLGCFAGFARRFSKGFGVALALGSGFLAGCADDGDGDGPQDPQGTRATIVLSDANNYSTLSSLTIPTVETGSAVDLDICWPDARQDFQCHDVDPLADIDNVSFLRLSHLTQQEIADKITAGQLTQSQVSGYVDYHTDHQSTCTKLSSFSLAGSKFDVEDQYVESADTVYLLILSKGTVPGVGARTMTFVKPTEASTNTDVSASSGCGMLDFQADLGDAAVVSVPAQKPWVVDWEDVTLDGQGNAIYYPNIDRLMLGFFEDKTVAELEAGIFDIEQTATSLWNIQLTGGRSADLATARERTSGEPFAGFDRTDGVWLLALLCGECQNPQPIVLSVLEPNSR
jgi:hypothetical protein